MAESRLSRPTSRGNPFPLPGFEGKRRTPLQAIRAKCLWCAGNSANEVRLCPVEGCALHEYRAGHRPETATLTPIKAIKAKCRDCYGLSWADVQDCPGLGLADGPCPLHAYRLGKNPNISTETREAMRQRAKDTRLAEKRRRSPHVGDAEAPGRTFTHPEDLNTGNAHPHPVSRSRIDETAPAHTFPHPEHESRPVVGQEACHAG